MTTTVTVAPTTTDVTVSSTDAISVDLTTSSTTLEIANGGLTFTGTLPSSPTFTSVSVSGGFFFGPATQIVTSTSGSGDSFPVFVGADGSVAQNPKTYGEVKWNIDTAVFTVDGSITADSFTSSLTYQESATGSVNASTFGGYAGKRVVLNGSSATTYELPDAVSGDVGKTWVIHNASSASITLDVDTNSQTVKHLTGAAVTSHTSDMTIVAGGVAELTCTAADTYIIVGGGIS